MAYNYNKRKWYAPDEDTLCRIYGNRMVTAAIAAALCLLIAAVILTALARLLH